jgi:hypothetical protein
VSTGSGIAEAAANLDGTPPKDETSSMCCCDLRFWVSHGGSARFSAGVRDTICSTILPAFSDLWTAPCRAIGIDVAVNSPLPIGGEGPPLFFVLAIGNNAM